MEAVTVQMGVDIGQRVDPTAICVAQVVKGADASEFLVRFLQRLALGTSYPAVCERLAAIYEKLKAADYKVIVYLDATGVGKPVVDMVRKAGVPAVPVFLTGGEHETREKGEIRLAKMLLVSRLQVLLQQRRVKFANTAEAQALIDELLNFELKRTDAANLQAGAFRTGSHDDLAIALGLATRESAGVGVLAPLGRPVHDAGRRQWYDRGGWARGEDVRD